MDRDPARAGAPPDGSIDVVLANAVLQWVPDHAAVFPALAAKLAPGGCLAVQMPDNLDEPAQKLMREIAADGPWRDKLAGADRARVPIESAEWYYRLLRERCSRVDVWRTTYHHPLARTRMRSSSGSRARGLRPFLDPLDPAERGGVSRALHRRGRERLSASRTARCCCRFPDSSSWRSAGSGAVTRVWCDASGRGVSAAICGSASHTTELPPFASRRPISSLPPIALDAKAHRAHAEPDAARRDDRASRPRPSSQISSRMLSVAQLRSMSIGARARVLEGVLHRFLRDAIQVIARLEVDADRRIVTGAKPHRSAAQGAALRQRLERRLEIAVGIGQRRETLHDQARILDAARREQAS